MFLQLHTLRDYCAALPNRDLSGLAKRVPYGNAERQRVSSQCRKRALRAADHLVRTADDSDDVQRDTLADLGRELNMNLSIRSREVFDRVVLPEMRAVLPDEDTAATWTRAFADLFRKEQTAAQDAEDADADDEIARLNQPIVIGHPEARALASVAAAFHAAAERGDGPSFEDLTASKSKKLNELLEKGVQGRTVKNTPQDVKDALANLRAVRKHCGIDGAMFGRFATHDILASVDSAVQVAHAVTVHPVAVEADYRTVVDEWQTKERGAANTGTDEIASSLFYEYAVADLNQLRENFPDCSPDDLGRLVGWLVRALHGVEPAAKLGSTAPYSDVPEMVVELGKRRPRSLVRAYQEAIVPRKLDGDLSAEARTRLDNLRVDANRRNGEPKHTWHLSATDAERGKPAVEVVADRAAERARAWFAGEAA